MMQLVKTPLLVQVRAACARIQASLVQTDYQHDIQIDATSGIYDCDCSGYVSYVLGQVSPDHLNVIPMESGETRLRAYAFYRYFASLDALSAGWRRIFRLVDSVPGDVLAWENTTDEPPPASGDTGHIVIVKSSPEMAGDSGFFLEVYDASDVLHFDDSRAQASGQITGVGTGRLKFKVDREGRPTAVEFNAEEQFRDHPMAIARCESFG